MARKSSSKATAADQFELVFDFLPTATAVAELPQTGLSETSISAPPVCPSPSISIIGPCTIYTDGGCEPNPGQGGWAAIIIGADGGEIEISGTVEDSTNNRMEIWAALQALRCLPEGVSAIVHTDSQYLQKGATEWLGGWKRRGWVNSAKQPVANKDLWQQIDAAISRREVIWKWVRGHADNAYNNRCDVLANTAAKKVI